MKSILTKKTLTQIFISKRRYFREKNPHLSQYIVFSYIEITLIDTHALSFSLVGNSAK